MKKKVLYLSLVVLFFTCFILVITDNTILIDEKIHDFLYNDSLVDIMKTITFFGGSVGVSIITCIVFLILLFQKQKKDAFGLIIVVVFITLINLGFKAVIARQRPDYILINETFYSFPSGHAMGSTALYGYLIYIILKSTLNRRNKAILTILFSCLIISIGISRIILGAHYFSDVFGGIVLSTILILIYCEIDNYIKIKNKEKL